jgi:hypothetical protein
MNQKLKANKKLEFRDFQSNPDSWFWNCMQYEFTHQAEPFDLRSQSRLGQLNGIEFNVSITKDNNIAQTVIE